MRITTFILVFLGFLTNLSAQINSSSFAPKVDFDLNGNGSTWLVTAEDLDGDGKKDILAAQDSGSIGYLRIFRNVATQGVINSATLLPYISIAGAINTATASVEDLDGDGKKDLVTTRAAVAPGNSSFSYYLNTSTPGNISFGPEQSVPTTSGISNIVLQDLDGDGKKDLVAPLWWGHKIMLFRSTSTLGTISFATPDLITIGTSDGLTMSVCEDLNSDGKPDIALLNYNTNTLYVLRNISSVGTIAFAAPVSYSTGSAPGRITTGDLDNDTKPDLIVGNYVAGTIGVFKNASTGSALIFNSMVTFTTYNTTGPITSQCFDFDNDGKKELVVGNWAASYLSIFKGFAQTGIINSSTLGNRKEFPTSGSPEPFIVDIDGDTKPDIVTINRAPGTISILRNQITPSGNLVAWYQMKGNGADSSGYENHGTASGVTATTDRYGNTNSAYTFDGTTTDYISVPPNMSFNPSTNANMLFTCWFKAGTSTTTLSRRIFNMQDGSNRNYDLSFDYQTRKLIYINYTGASSAVNITSTMTFASGTWYHVAVRVDSANNSSVFVNGVLEMSSTNTITKPVNPTFNIGRHLTQGWNFIGDIDEMKIYTKYVSNTGISTLYANEKAGMFYYTKATGNLNQLSTWGTNTDGSGTSPLSFDSANTTYVVVNNSSPQTGGSFMVSGSRSALVLGNGLSPFNLFVASGDTLSCDSVFISDNITLTVQGRFISSRLNAATTSNVQYISSLPQLMASGTYGNLVVVSGIKTLTGSTTVRNNLGMATSLNTNGHSFILGQSDSSTGTLNYTQGTINGKFTRWFAKGTNSGSTGLFPVGTATKYLPFQVEFSSAPTTGGTIAAEFVASNPGNTGLPITDFSNGFIFIDKAAPDGYWKVTSAINTGTFKASATANNFAGVNTYADLRMLRRNTGGAWAAPGTSIPGTGSNASVVIARTGLTALDGEYGVGGDQSQNPLPVKLIRFTVQKADQSNCIVGWNTASEFNADKFIVQRSQDLIKWENRAQVKATGNSSEKVSYKVQDNIDGLRNVVYYRLLQLDYNGDQYTSHTVSVALNKTDLENTSLSVYPNPASGEISIDGTDHTEGVIYNQLGIIVKRYSSTTISISDLPSGVYFIRNGNQVERFIKQ
jgi:hypothetical protein